MSETVLAMRASASAAAAASVGRLIFQRVYFGTPSTCGARVPPLSVQCASGRSARSPVTRAAVLPDHVTKRRTVLMSGNTTMWGRYAETSKVEFSVIRIRRRRKSAGNSRISESYTQNQDRDHETAR